MLNYESRILIYVTSLYARVTEIGKEKKVLHSHVPEAVDAQHDFFLHREHDVWFTV